MKIKHRSTLIFLFTFLFVRSFAQLKEQDYTNQANEVRKYVWGWNIKAFNERVVPAEYAKYSTVILAKHEEITGLAKSKINWGGGLMLVKQRDLTYTHTTRELVKINDQAALDEYSEINFQKFGQKFRDKLTTFLGVRIIKPDGTMKEINPDEIILTENSDKNKKGKLAVSGLQVGDMLDYFIQTVEFYDLTYGGDLDYENFVFADESPVLHYSLHVEANKKLSVEYRTMNGAPDFKITKDADENNIMDAEENNIPPFPVNLWMSAYRQIPLVRFHMLLGGGSHKAGQIYKNPPADETVNATDASMKYSVLSGRQSVPQIESQVKKYAESYLSLEGGGKLKHSSLSIYYALRHLLLYKPDAENVGVVNQQRNYFTPNATTFLIYLESLLAHYDIDAQYILIPSRYGPRADEVMSTTDYELALLSSDDHIYTLESVFDIPDQMPYYMEGQQAITLNYSMRLGGPKSVKGVYSTSYSSASKNIHTEDVSYTFNPADPQKITVDRKTTLTGLMSRDGQKELGLYEDVYEEERNGMGIKESFTDELKDSHKGKKIVDEYENAFADARKEWKDDFKDEIEEQFSVKPEELINCKVDQSGIFDTKSAFIYDCRFTVNAWVKKAGNNFILDAGKMIGEQLKIKPDQRDRKVDAYMPYARTLQYNMQIAVPAGFTAEGLDKLNTNFDNSTASFITTAKVEGGVIKISITKVYKTSLVTAEKWPELLSMIDAADTFENARILLKKS